MQEALPAEPSLAVEWWPIDRPRPYEKNPRTISALAIEKVAASLEAFGWRQPIVVDCEGVIIVGHTRLLAARRLGHATVPVHVAAGLDPNAARAYRIADNRAGEETGWDLSALSTELQELDGAGFDLGPTGFGLSDLAEFGQGPPEARTADSSPGKPGALIERFGVAPFSVLNAREGWWQDRKRAWLDLGIKSELGRGASPGGSPRPLDRAASPGGSPRPAADYRQRGRGDGRGRAT